MANPADNLDRIADLAGEIRDFTYNSSNSLAFIDIGIATPRDNIQIYITKIGKVRVYNKKGEMKA